MVVAVTGGTGFVGAGVVRAHLAKGDEARILTRRSAVPALAAARVFQGDLVSGDIPAAFVEGADVLYHCAGELRDERNMRALHIDGTKRLLDVACGSVRRWVQLSSVGVYGPHVRGAVTEHTPQAPVGPYEETKAASDDLVRAAQATGALATVILQPSIIFGADMPNRSLFSLISAIDRGIFFFVGPPGASANYVPLDNVVEALLLCGSAARAAGDVFIVSDFMTMEEFVGTIAAALAKAPPRLRVPRAPLRAAASILGAIPGWPLTASRVDALSSRAIYCTQHIESVLDYRPRSSVRGALERTVAQWRIDSAHQ